MDSRSVAVLAPQWRLQKPCLGSDPEGQNSGFVNLTEDDDNYIRRQQLLIPDAGQARMHFRLALFAQAQHFKKVAWDDANQTLRLDSEKGAA